MSILGSLVENGPMLRGAVSRGNLKVLRSMLGPAFRGLIQQRVTGNLFVTFATDATSTDREVIKLEYQATPRVSLSGTRDQNGGFAFDVRIKKTW